MVVPPYLHPPACADACECSTDFRKVAVPRRCPCAASRPCSCRPTHGCRDTCPPNSPAAGPCRTRPCPSPTSANRAAAARRSPSPAASLACRAAAPPVVVCDQHRARQTHLVHVDARRPRHLPVPTGHRRAANRKMLCIMHKILLSSSAGLLAMRGTRRVSPYSDQSRIAGKRTFLPGPHLVFTTEPRTQPPHSVPALRGRRHDLVREPDAGDLHCPAR